MNTSKRTGALRLLAIIRQQTANLQDLCQTLGVDATLPETTVKELVLQVIYHNEDPSSMRISICTSEFHLYHIDPKM